MQIFAERNPEYATINRYWNDAHRCTHCRIVGSHKPSDMVAEQPQMDKSYGYGNRSRHGAGLEVW